MTTFARLAKVLKGYVKPANWIERAFASVGGAILPSVSGSDNGKILGVSAGNWAVIEPPKELPAVTSVDNGKVLGVDDGAWGAIDATSGLPSVTSADEGKVLTVDSSGDWVAETVSGGGGNIEVVTFTQGAGGSISADKTFIEIARMVADGKTVLGRINGVNSTGYMQSANSESFEFVFLTANSGENPELFVLHIIYTSEQISAGAFSVEGSN